MEKHITKTGSLTAELEAALSRGDLSTDRLADLLVKAYYLPLFRLAVSLLDDRDEAAFSALQALIHALREIDRYPRELGMDLWLYRAALENCRRARRRLKFRRALSAALPLAGHASDFGTSEPSTPADACFWLALDSLPDEIRLVMLLHFYLGWDLRAIAGLIPDEVGRVAQQIGFARIQLRKAWHLEGFSLEAVAGDALDGQLTASLQRRWPLPNLAEADWAILAGEVEQQAVRRRR